MIELGLLLLASVVLSWWVTSMVLRRAECWKLVQSPNYRSSHALPTPNGGGLGIVVACLVAGVWLAWRGANELWLVLALSLPLAWMGLRDDVKHVSAKFRLAVQVAVVLGLLAALDGLPPFAVWAGIRLDGWLLFSLLLLAGAWWINLFNFMDGIDGLAGMQAVFMLLGGAMVAAWADPAASTNPVWILMACVAAATAGFLLLNWPPAKIFMGDVGSTWLAFMIFALALLSIQAGWLSYATWLVLAAVFVTDATVTLFTRMARGERWYEAHRSHAYQKLARRWGGHRPVTLLAVGINLLWLAPLAGACAVWPQWAFAWVLLAYLPLVVGAVAVGAGRFLASTP